MQAMMIHKGTHIASLEEIEAVPVPLETSTYTPVPHSDFIRNMEAIGHDMLEPKGFTLERAQYAITDNGQRLFGANVYRNGSDSQGLTTVMRNSYDKSITAAVAMGTTAWICDNLSISGEISVFHKHTPRVLEYLRDNLVLAFHKADAVWNKALADEDAFRNIVFGNDRAHELFGKAYGRGLLKPNQFSLACREWVNPTFDHGEKTLYRWYQACTEVYKGLPIETTLQKHRQLHDFVKAETPLGAARIILSNN